MSILQIKRDTGNVTVQYGGGGRTELYPSVVIHGCETDIPSRGMIAVHGVQSTWTDDNGKLHISDDKKATNSNSGLGVSL